MKLEKMKPAAIGFWQAIATLVYVALISWFMVAVSASMPGAPQMSAIILWLLLLVFSAGITGSLVFGYPIYLLIQRQTKRAFEVLGYTFGFMLVIVAVFSVIILT